MSVSALLLLEEKEISSVWGERVSPSESLPAREADSSVTRVRQRYSPISLPFSSTLSMFPSFFFLPPPPHGVLLFLALGCCFRLETDVQPVFPSLCASFLCSFPLCQRFVFVFFSSLSVLFFCANSCHPRRRDEFWQAHAQKKIDDRNVKNRCRKKQKANGVKRSN